MLPRIEFIKKIHFSTFVSASFKRILKIIFSDSSKWIIDLYQAEWHPCYWPSTPGWTAIRLYNCMVACLAPSCPVSTGTGYTVRYQVSWTHCISGRAAILTLVLNSANQTQSSNLFTLKGLKLRFLIDTWFSTVIIHRQMFFARRLTHTQLWGFLRCDESVRAARLDRSHLSVQVKAPCSAAARGAEVRRRAGKTPLLIFTLRAPMRAACENWHLLSHCTFSGSRLCMCLFGWQ